MTSLRLSLSHLIARLPLPVLQKLVPRTVIHLFYHLVSEQPLAHARHLYPHRPLEQFEQDLVYLKQHFEPVAYPQLLQQKLSSRDKRRIAVSVSFDDGFAECYSYARPLLLKHGIPCIFFLATNFIDNQAMYYRNKVSLCIEQVVKADGQALSGYLSRLNTHQGLSLNTSQDFTRWVKTITDEELVDQVCGILGVDIPAYLQEKKPYLTRDQVNALVEGGFTIGAHSRQHHKLGRLTQEKMAEEILGSCRRVAEITAQEQVPFSFPNSGDGVEREFLEDLRRHNPLVGLLFDTKGLKLDRPFILNRIWVEAPRFNPDGKERIGTILKRAYAEYLSGL